MQLWQYWVYQKLQVCSTCFGRPGIDHCVRTDLDIYTGFIPSQLMRNTSGCFYSL